MRINKFIEGNIYSFHKEANEFAWADTYDYDGIQSITSVGNQIIIIDGNGIRHIQNIGDKMILDDGEGTIYLIDEEGNVTEQHEGFNIKF